MQASPFPSDFLVRRRRSLALSSVLFLAFAAAACGDDDDDDGDLGPSIDCIDESDFSEIDVDPDDVEPIAFGDSDGGTISTSDYQFQNGTFFDIYVFNLDEEEAVQIDMQSSQVDAWLILYDDNFNVIADDDDSGNGTNARIIEELSAGCYIVAANTFDAEETGSYTITVEAD